MVAAWVEAGASHDGGGGVVGPGAGVMVCVLLEVLSDGE